MKAFLLAAGYGTRLRPLTNTVPKCLVPICGKPLLQWWVELFKLHGITDVLINTHYLREPVAEFIKENNKKGNVILHEAYEPELLGSGGTIRDNRQFIGEDESFMVCYADNLTNTDLAAFQRFHQNHNGILSMALFHTNLAKQCGIAALDEQKRIIEFVEKPDKPKSNLANAGMYIANKEMFSYLWYKASLDFGKDVLPKLVGNMYGWEDKDYLIDIGTMENYQKAQIEWETLIHNRNNTVNTKRN